MTRWGCADPGHDRKHAEFAELLNRLTGNRPVDPRRCPDYDQLARYNAEKARGIMHTPEHAAAMAKLQDDFNRRHHTTRHE